MSILIVSNRLPFTVGVKNDDLSFHTSAGGLVSGLTSYLQSGSAGDSIWIAWPGDTIPERLQERLTEQAVKQYNAYPVYFTEEVMDKFYHGFCNKTIWPLFHYFPTYAVFKDEYWDHYKSVNQTFCDAVLEVARPGDTIWVHDYHLMLLPQLLRERLPEASIGFFLHIPFPSYEVFRLLPGKWRTEILQGLLGADLIGFHTYSYTQYFLKSVLRVLGHEPNMKQITLKDRIVVADCFPMGIDYEKYNSAAKDPAIMERKRRLKESLGNRTMVLSLDRLDYTKGILHRLNGYELFLERYGEWHQRVAMILIVVPSRIGVRDYQQQKRQIDQLVGNINGRFGTIEWTPIVYQYRSIPFDELISIYSACEVALVTPLRDGMNLISKEYIACKHDRTGVLILSEMAGAATELGEALIINPNNHEEIATVLNEALKMPLEEQIRRNGVMQRRLKRYSIDRWASDFLQKLHSVKQMQENARARMMTPKIAASIEDQYRKAKRRLVLLDYDGTLISFLPDPQRVRPDRQLVEMLRDLSGDRANECVLVTGRDRATLDDWFGSLPNLSLVAEDGMLMKEAGSEWFAATPLRADWKREIYSLLELFVDRLPGSFMEEKEFSLAWHYRKAEEELASETARRLADHLRNIAINMNLQVASGDKVIEIRNAGITKASAALHWLTHREYDFILAIGVDEDLFRPLPSHAYGIKVGLAQTLAQYSLKSDQEVRRLIDRLRESVAHMNAGS